MSPSTLDAARDWLQRNEKHPLRNWEGMWYWFAASDRFPEAVNHLPIAVWMEILPEVGGGDWMGWPTRQKAYGAAVEAVARAMGAGWEPEKGD